jgi:signal transduction histidine kinase
VFDRFFRVDKARSRELGGAGLGLSIVKSICTAHHGRVEASSLPGQGSRFRVELPLAAPLTNHQKKHES